MVVTQAGLSETVLNVRIDGYWTAKDFSEVLKVVSDLYAWFSSFQSSLQVDDQSEARVLELWNDEFAERLSPQVTQIRFSSPGSFSVIGLGECLKQVKEFLLYLMDRDLLREKLALENEALELRNIKARRRLAEKKLALANKRKNLDRLRYKEMTAMLQAARGLSIEDKRLAETVMHSFLKERDQSMAKISSMASENKIRSVDLKSPDDDGGGGEFEMA